MLAHLHLMCCDLLFSCRPHLILFLCILRHLPSITLRLRTVALRLGVGCQRLTLTVLHRTPHPLLQDSPCMLLW
jgi:hypothetical protein